MFSRILNAVLMVAFVALLCGYVSLVFADKKAKYEVVVPRGCLKKIDLTADTECRIIGEHNLYCAPVEVTRMTNCTITRVVK